MNPSILTSLLGIAFISYDDSGRDGYIVTPFRFSDGDELPVFIEMVDDVIRFSDDGDVILHFDGRGMEFENAGDIDWIRDIAWCHGVTLTEEGELEISASLADAPAAFASYLSAMLAFVAWERQCFAVDQPEQAAA